MNREILFRAKHIHAMDSNGHLNGTWVCVNDRSEYCADWTEYSDSCEEWEGRD